MIINIYLQEVMMKLLNNGIFQMDMKLEILYMEKGLLQYLLAMIINIYLQQVGITMQNNGIMIMVKKLKVL